MGPRRRPDDRTSRRLARLVGCHLAFKRWSFAFESTIGFASIAFADCLEASCGSEAARGFEVVRCFEVSRGSEDSPRSGPLCRSEPVRGFDGRHGSNASSGFGCVRIATAGSIVCGFGPPRGFEAFRCFDDFYVFGSLRGFDVFGGIGDAFRATNGFGSSATVAFRESDICRGFEAPNGSDGAFWVGDGFGPSAVSCSVACGSACGIAGCSREETR